MAQHPDQPNTFGGVLTRPAAQVVAVLLALGAFAVAVLQIRDAIGAPSRPAVVLTRDDVDELRAEMRTLSDKLGSLSERLARIEGRSEMRTSGIGR